MHESYKQRAKAEEMMEKIFIRIISNPEFLKLLKTHHSITAEFNDGRLAQEPMQGEILKTLLDDIGLYVLVYLEHINGDDTIVRYSSTVVPFSEYYSKEIADRIDDFWNNPT